MANALANQGCNIEAIARRLDKLQKVCKEIEEKHGVEAIPMERYGEEGEPDTSVVFLASKHSSYVTGIALPVDGGYTCI